MFIIIVIRSWIYNMVLCYVQVKPYLYQINKTFQQFDEFLTLRIGNTLLLINDQSDTKMNLNTLQIIAAAS